MKEVLLSLKDIRKHLMTGVSNIVPIVVAGGLLTCLGTIFQSVGWLSEGFSAMGSAGLGIFVSILGAYIAYSMADKPGFAPGLIAAYMSTQIGAGFLGALIGGIVAGCVVILLKQIKFRRELVSLQTIVIIPLIGSLVSAGLIYWVLGGPIVAMSDALTDFLMTMSEGSAVVLGVLQGSMHAVDLGGMINKTAYMFSIAMTERGYLISPAICAVAGVTPPVGMALAVLLNKKKYTKTEQGLAASAVIMGCVGVSEGAIPFAVRDPLRVIPSCVIGSAISGAIVAGFGVECSINLGGLVVLPGISNIPVYFIAWAVGSLATALIVNLLKKDLEPEEEIEEAESEVS